MDGNGAGNDGAIVEITDPTNPILVGQFGSAHNVFIDDAGYMYLEAPGLRIYDLNPDPKNPTFLWSKFSTGGHDATVVGNRLYDFHGPEGTYIYDVSNRASPVLLGSITDPSIQYHHSGWTSQDENYLFINDELASGGIPDFTVWDISTPASPARVGQYEDPSAVVHNSYRIGNFLYVAYYSAGFRVFDISSPTNLFLADEYDTSAFTGDQFVGAFGCYPFTPSGNIYVSDMQNGLFVFSFEPTPTAIGEDAPQSFVLRQNYPNPFNPVTTISYELKTTVPVTLTIFDATGRRIRTLVNNELQAAGTPHVTWDGRGDGGHPVASGVYFYELTAGGKTDTKRMTLLK